MAGPSLQDGIDKAGSPVDLLWKPNAEPFKVPVVAPEFVGWREEQGAWRKSVTLSDLCHHMHDLFIEGPDARRLLSDHGANSFESFEIGQAKQLVTATKQGYIVTDGILMRNDEQRFTLSGVPAAQNWIRYHGEKGDYDVEMQADPDSAFRQSGNPVLFRYQVQGPRALDLVEKVFGGPLPKTKFFHSTQVSLDGREFRALRHGMTGQPGYEFIGDWDDGAYVKDALISAGEAFDLVQVGGLAYATNGIESGWIPTPTPAIYSDPALEDYRRWLSLFSFEGQKPLHGTFYSENIEDYYVSPWELAYGRSISSDHDYVGKEALERTRETAPRKKVTLVFDPDEVRDVFGADHDFILSYARYRVETGSGLAGMTYYTAYIDPAGTILSLALVNKDVSEPGTRVNVVWGEHPGRDAPADVDTGFARISATVQVAPYDDYARTSYRQD